MSDIVSELLDRAYGHKPNHFLCERAAMEIERLRLTDAEREAVFFFAAIDSKDATLGGYADTLRKLLERLQ